MGTPAIIIVEDFPHAKVYKHFDGYPDSTLPWLKSFNRAFSAMRRDDPEYKFAQLLRSSARDAGRFNLDDSEYTGWGVLGSDTRVSACYTYILRKDGTVEWFEGSEVTPDGKLISNDEDFGLFS